MCYKANCDGHTTLCCDENRIWCLAEVRTYTGDGKEKVHRKRMT